MKFSKAELSEAVLNYYPKTLPDAKEELLQAFKYLKAKFGSALLSLRENGLKFDSATAEIVEL